MTEPDFGVLLCMLQRTYKPSQTKHRKGECRKALPEWKGFIMFVTLILKRIAAWRRYRANLRELGREARLMHGSRVLRPHFVKHDGNAEIGDLPRRLRSGEPGADDVDGNQSRHFRRIARMAPQSKTPAEWRASNL